MTKQDIVDPAFWALIGAVLGSAGGALVTRWPDGRRMRAGRSACDACGTTLGIADLVPVLSFAWRRGRCRWCGARIDAAQPLLEAIMALAGGLIGWRWQPLATLTAAGAAAGAGGVEVGAAMPAPLIAAIAALGAGAVMAVLAVLDWRHLWLPDRLTLPLLAGGLALGGVVTGVSLPDRIIGAGAAGALAWGLAAAFRARRGVDGLGLGDVKMMAGIAAWAGWMAMPAIIAIGAAGGLVHAWWRGDAKARYPFGAHLIFAAVLVGGWHLS